MIIALQALYLFQKSLLAVFEQILEPYFKSIFFYKSTDACFEEESDDDVYSEFDEEKGVVFYPPVYAQRYAAVTDCLLDTRWRGQLEKVIDFGCNDMSFIKCLKDIPGIKEILGVDLEPIPVTLDLKSDRYNQNRENPLKISLYQGNAADPDYRLIGTDAVVSIEMIEHMLPHDLERFVHNIFGFIRPWVVVITTPNGDFNVLFKALESNGLRRLDHMFEWSRDQFHDWCSNIVTRYPEYSVSCKGIGPGPQGTSHLGCCSQLALFVASKYEKQTELGPNSLAIVECNSSTPMSDSMDSWDMTESVLDNSIQSLTNDEYKSLSFIPSSLFQHKHVQCNVKEDVERNYLMFEEDTFYIRFASEHFISVYYMENLTNRLHCTNNQVKRFSKTTHQLMAKNKVDSLFNAKDLVGDIRHLSKLANPDSQESIWKNINWGEDAPYWNKYYKIMKEYSYPFAAKSDETRILEVIAEEMNRLIYSSSEDSFSQYDKMEIPIAYIMGVVSHITDDEDNVRELLEWNGYEVVGDTVVYTKVVADDLPVDVQKEWIDVDSVSDWDCTDSQSSVMLENMDPDMFEYDLQISLDRKISELVKLSKRMDVSYEVERLVSRLVGLVQDLRTELHPTCLKKLSDLLAVTQAVMMKQRRHFIADCKKAIRFSKRYKEDQNLTISIGIEKAFKEENIVDRYGSILLSSDSDQSKENLKYYYSNDSHFNINENMFEDDTDQEMKEILQSYDSLIQELELREVNYKEIEKVDTSINEGTENIHDLQKMATTKLSTDYSEMNNYGDGVIVIKAETKRKRQKKFIGHKNKLKHKKYKKIQKFTSLAPVCINNYFNNGPIKYRPLKIRLHKKVNDCVIPTSKSGKPIPSSLMNLFNSSENKIDGSQESSIGDVELSKPERNVTVKDQENTIIKRTIDFKSATTLEICEKKDAQSGAAKTESGHIEKNIEEPYLYLYDINEPSTSNGIRHICADIQCGPDDVMDESETRSDTCNLNITHKRLNTGFKIQTSMLAFQNTIETNTSNHVFDNCELLNVNRNIVDDIKDERDNSQKHELRVTKPLIKSVFENQIVINRDAILKPPEAKNNKKRYSLSRGAIYVHCYKNSNSEDIVYQGKWKECCLKTLTTKTPIVRYRRRNEIKAKKKNVITDKGLLNKSGPTINNREYKKKVSYRLPVPINGAHKKSPLNLSEVKENIRHTRLVRPNAGVRPLEASTYVTKFLDTRHIFDINNYIPEYLKRRIQKYSMDKKFNLNLNIVLNTYSEGKRLNKLPIKHAGNARMARNKPGLRKIPTYQVYRNEIDKEAVHLKGVENDKLKIIYVPATSSYVPCSSNSTSVPSSNKKSNGVGYSSERSSSDKYKPECYNNKIRGIRKCINNEKKIPNKFESIKHTTEVPRSLEALRPPCLTETDGFLKLKEITNRNANTYSTHKIQSYESAYKLTFDEAESIVNADRNTDNNIEKHIRSYLITASLSYFERFATVDKKAGVYNLDQVDDKESVRSDYTSTLTPLTTSSANTELFIEVKEENDSKLSLGYSNIDSGVQDVELLSPISVASVTTSKFSDYLSADNEFEDSSSLNSNSIFSLPQNSCGEKENISNDTSIALHEDRVDLKNSVDAEIRTDQQQLLEISQRSSQDTYMSCSTDDDPQIPYWMFESESEEGHIATSLLEDETEDSEDDIDDSEEETDDNPQEAAVVGIGAGDGRGIHSDISRDTSGRGTSLSGETSSLESEDTLSNASSHLSEYNVEHEHLSHNTEPANEPMEDNDTTNLPSRPLPNATHGDARSLDEYDLE